MKTRRIYRVEFEQRFQNDKLWAKETLDVLANGSAERAIAAAKKSALSETWTDDERTPPKTFKCNGFRLLSVETIAEADIEA